MDIYILRDGKETGPFSEEETQEMLKRGDAEIADLAWSPGLAEWQPLHTVLYPAAGRAHSNARSKETGTPEARPLLPPEAATAKQKAFLSYMGIRFDASISKEEAALLVNDAMENPRDPALLARWNEERLKLHPDLFAAELQARKDQRITRFLHVAETEGAECVSGVTKAHCQVLVGYLDAKYPNWDANETEAVWNYFFPAVREKFPQLIRKGWQDRLQFPKAPKLASAKKTHRAPARAARKRPSALALLARGLAIGLIIVGVGIGALYLSRHPEQVEKIKQQGERLMAGMSRSSAKGKTTPDPQKKLENAAAQGSASDLAPPAGSGSTVAAPGSSSNADDGQPDMPVSSANDPAPGANMPLFDAPGTPAATPAPALLPGPKTHVQLVQPVSIQTPYGPMELKTGMTFPLIGQEGVNVIVRFQGRVIELPASATDLGGAAPPQ